MGSPAARIMDPTVHGGMIVVGMPTVLIGGMPAARIGDMHICPLVNVLIPHVGGPLILGAFTTLVGGPPQSRQGDMLICVGPPDAVMMGCPTVLVGMSPAAGSMSVIVAGALAGVLNFLGMGGPKTTLNADGTFDTQLNDQISIHGSPEYTSAVVADIAEFTSSKTGAKWQEAFAKTGKHINIEPIPASDAQNNGYTQGGVFSSPIQVNPLADVGLMDPYKEAGPGSDSTIQFNPSLKLGYTGTDGKPYTLEGSDVMGHEMIHSLHNANGENIGAEATPNKMVDNYEEARTIGVSGFESDASSKTTLDNLNMHGFEDTNGITEAELSKERGRSPRPDHGFDHLEYQDASGNWFETVKDPVTGRARNNAISAPADAVNRPNH